MISLRTVFGVILALIAANHGFAQAPPDPIVKVDGLRKAVVRRNQREDCAEHRPKGNHRSLPGFMADGATDRQRS